MGNGSPDFANNVRHLTQTFCSYFTSYNNQENPFSLFLLVLYNNNESREQSPFLLSMIYDVNVIKYTMS